MLFGLKKRCQERVAFFGGSFNPPHKGHTAICEMVISKGLVDEIWVVPCFMHPFNKPLAPFEDRIAMSKLAFTKHGMPVKVLDVEKEIGGVSHTVKTIQFLKVKYPKHDFSLIRGRDLTDDKKKWKDFDAIERMVNLIDIPRGPDSPIPDISSTEIRRRVEAGEPFADLVESEIAVYIATKGLYKKKEGV